MDAFFSPDSSTLAVRSYDGTATLWDVATGSRRTQIASSQSDGGVCTIAFSPGGDRLLTGSQEPGDSHAATLWDIPSGKPIVRIDDFPDGISAGGIKTKSPMFDQHIRVAWGPDRFVTINFNLGLGSLWDAASQAKVCDFPVGANMMELSAAGRFSSQLSLAQGGARFIVAGFDDTARVFALHDAKLIAALKHPFPGLSSAELSADGSTALTFGPGTPPVVWSVPGGSITLSLDTDTSNVNEAHLSADGRYVAGACSDQCVRLWDARTGQVSTTFREENQPGEGVDSLGAPIDLAAMQGKRVALGFLSLQFDPHGRWVAAINDIGHLCLWDIPSRRQLLRWKLDAQSRDAHLAVSPDGNRLALTGENGAVTLFNLTPDAPQQALK
jgi:WD40 repeat protein